jgi:hypothetical protein
MILIKNCTLLSLQLLKIVGGIWVHFNTVRCGRDGRMERVGLLVVFLLRRLRHVELHADGKKIEDCIMLICWISRDREVGLVRMALDLLFLVAIRIIKLQIQIQVEERGKVGVRHVGHDARLRAKEEGREVGERW